jgi:hypothetical protein
VSGPTSGARSDPWLAGLLDDVRGGLPCWSAREATKNVLVKPFVVTGIYAATQGLGGRGPSGVAFRRHHMVPKAVLRALPKSVARIARGARGRPNIWPIPAGLHDMIHRGPRGGPYNAFWFGRLGELAGSPGRANIGNVMSILEEAIMQFGLGAYRP